MTGSPLTPEESERDGRMAAMEDRSAPETAKMRRFSLRPIYLALASIAALLLGVGGFFAYREIVAPTKITTYDECIKYSGGGQPAIYPGVCVTSDGRRFVQILTEEEQKKLEFPSGEPTPSCIPRPYCLDHDPRCLMAETEDMCKSPSPKFPYVCPKTEWVDCMPGPDDTGKLTECTEDFLAWAKSNCPKFKGAAY